MNFKVMMFKKFGDAIIKIINYICKIQFIIKIILN
jgi:hypothetical protein